MKHADRMLCKIITIMCSLVQVEMATGDETGDETGVVESQINDGKPSCSVSLHADGRFAR